MRTRGVALFLAFALVGVMTVEVGPALAAPGQSGAATAMLLARQTGHRVEVATQRTETSRTFANPDGTWNTEVAAGPVRVRDAQGTWRDIDTTLIADADGVRPRVAKASMRFSPGGKGPLAQLGVNGKTVTETLLGLSLPAPTLRGEVATYANVTPGVDLSVQARPGGFEFSLVLKRRPTAAPTWRIALGHDGLRVSQDASGGLHFTDAAGKQVLVADAPMMWDAQTDPATSIGRHHAAVASRLVDDRRGGQVLEISPAAAFLADPGVVYPVTVDPSVVLATSLDTYVESDYTTAKGSATELRAGHINNVDTKTYLDFGTGVVNGKHIISARVDIYQWWASSCTPVTMDVRALTSGFNNSTVWTNRPSESQTVYGQATTGHGAAGTSCASGAWVSFPVTGLIQGWADGSIIKYGMTIYANDMTVNGNYARFYSYDHGSGVPKLIIYYDDAQVQPVPIEQYSQSTAIQTSTGALEYAYVDNIGRVVHGRQPDPENFSGIQWTTLSGLDAYTGQPTLAEFQDDRVHLVAHYTKGAVRTRTRMSRTLPDWDAWVDQGGWVSSRAVVGKQPDATLAVFAVDPQGQLWLLQQERVNGPYLAWRSLGAANLTGAPVVVALSNGLQLVGLDKTTGGMKTASYRAGALSAWTSLGGSGFTGDPAVVVLPGPVLRVFVRGADGTIVTKKQDAGGTWPAAWDPVAGLAAAGSPAAVLSPSSGRIELVARDADGHYFSTGETAQGSGTWRTWVQIVDQFGNPAVGATDPSIVTYNDSAGPTWGFVIRTSDQVTIFFSTRQFGGSPALSATSSAESGAAPSDGPPTFTRQVLPSPPSSTG